MDCVLGMQFSTTYNPVIDWYARSMLIDVIVLHIATFTAFADAEMDAMYAKSFVKGLI